jgi:cytochrome c-type biogenesis protein CcsB
MEGRKYFFFLPLLSLTMLLKSMIILNDFQVPVFASFTSFFAMVSYWSAIAFPKQKIFSKIGRNLVYFTTFFLAITLLVRWVLYHYFPLSNLYESLIFLSWGLGVIHLYLEKKTLSNLIGSLLIPILFFLCSFSSLTLPLEMQKASPLVPSLQSNWLMMHVSMMLISYATLIAGSLISLLYLILDIFPILNISQLPKFELNFLTQLKYSKIAILDILDFWSYRIIGLGFPFLTIGIISGAVWANEAWGSYWSWDPKETWALITWLIFATYLHSRLIKGWQGKIPAILGTLGFFVIWICYLGVNFLGKGLHSYGWVLS